MTLFGNGRPGDIATQPLQLFTLMSLGGHPGMQAETIEFGHSGIVLRGFRFWWDGLQGEYLAAFLRADGHSVTYRRQESGISYEDHFCIF